MPKYLVNGSYTSVYQEEVEADNPVEAIAKFKEKTGRKDDEYEKVDFEVEEDFLS